MIWAGVQPFSVAIASMRGTSSRLRVEILGLEPRMRGAPPSMSAKVWIAPVKKPRPNGA